MKFCGNCGTQLEDGAHYCPNCGAPVVQETAQTAVQVNAGADAQTESGTQVQSGVQAESGAQTEFGAQTQPGTGNTAQSAPVYTATVVTQPKPAAPKTNGFAIAGLVLGICSLLFGWACCFNITGILGLIFSIIGMCQTGEGKGNGRGLAIAGLVLSIVSILILIAVGLLSQAFVYYNPDDLFDMYDGIFWNI